MALTIEQQKTIIRLCIYDLFDSLGTPRPHDVKIEQTAEKITEGINDTHQAYKNDAMDDSRNDCNAYDS